MMMRFGRMGARGRRGGSGGGPAYTPLSLPQVGDKFAYWNPAVLSSLWATLDRSQPAVVGGPVRVMDDLSGNGIHRVAPSDDARPILRQSGSFYFLDHDGIDDTMLLSGAGLDLARNVTGFTLVAAYRIKSTIAATGWIAYASIGTSPNSSRLGLSRASSGNQLSAGGRRLDNDGFQNIVTSASTAVQVATVLFDWTNTDLFLRRAGGVVAQSTSWLTAGATSNTASQRVAWGSNGASSGFLDYEDYGGIMISRVLTAPENALNEPFFAALNGATV